MAAINPQKRNVTKGTTARKRPTRPKPPNPPRPNHPVTFTIPKHLLPPASQLIDQRLNLNAKTKDARSRSSTPGISHSPRHNQDQEPPILRLTRINILLNAIHRRNKNQHRNQPFYRQLSYLRRSIAKLINLHEQSAKLSTSASGATNSTTAAETRQRFEKEFQLRSQREGLEEFVRENVVPRAYVAFSGLVADTQFANLGLVLLGVLADIVGIVGSMRRVDFSGNETESGNEMGVQSRGFGVGTGAGRKLVGLSSIVTGLNQKTIERVYDSDGGIISEVEIGSELGALDKNGKRKMGGAYGDDNDTDMGEVITREELGGNSNTLQHETLGALHLSDVGGNQQHTTQEDQIAPQERVILDVVNPQNKTSISIGMQSATTTRPIASHAPTAIQDPGDEMDTAEASQPSVIPQPHTKSYPLPPNDEGRYRQKNQGGILEPRNPTDIDTLASISAPQETETETETVPRDKSRQEKRNEEASSTKQGRDSKERVKSAEKTKRRKKKRNAIDDLFSGFG